MFFPLTREASLNLDLWFMSGHDLDPNILSLIHRARKLAYRARTRSLNAAKELMTAITSSALPNLVEANNIRRSALLSQFFLVEQVFGLAQPIHVQYIPEATTYYGNLRRLSLAL